MPKSRGRAGGELCTSRCPGPQGPGRTPPSTTWTAPVCSDRRGLRGNYSEVLRFFAELPITGARTRSWRPGGRHGRTAAWRNPPMPGRGSGGLAAHLRLHVVDDGVGWRVHLVDLAHMLGDLGDQLFIRAGSSLPTAGVIGIPSPELGHLAPPWIFLCEFEHPAVVGGGQLLCRNQSYRHALTREPRVGQLPSARARPGARRARGAGPSPSRFESACSMDWTPR